MFHVYFVRDAANEFMRSVKYDVEFGVRTFLLTYQIKLDGRGGIT